MRCLFILTALLAAALFTINSAEASGKPVHSHGHSVQGHPSHGKPSHHSGYHLKHGTKFKHGYYYSGKNHKHWTYRFYWSKYHCNCYYCPSTSCWYYWCGSESRYYPINYITTAAPAPESENNSESLPSEGELPTVDPDGKPLR